jgi:NADH-quinone oxidoreductase subunit G
MPTVTLTINGIEVTAEPGSTIMQVADKAGIFIPRFCYHPGLSIAGNCRICLVEVEKMPKLVTSCSTVVGDGMVVYTDNEKVREARRGIMELMLINHPLDCPICDQAGECSLQDNYMLVGLHKSRFKFEKHHKAKVTELPPHLMLDAERCILCGRCVRFCREITKTGEFAIGERGHHAEIDTFAHRGLDNGYVGNLHQICPVGALTSKDFRFSSRVWLLKEHPSVCIGCSTGCNIFIDEKDGQVRRFRARENQAVNSYWMCDEGRYSYKSINDEKRLTDPRIKSGKHMRNADWDEIYESVAARLKSVAARGETVAIVAGAGMTNEEMFLASKIAQNLGAKIDFRVDNSYKELEKSEDELLRRVDKNPNSKGGLTIGLVNELTASEMLKEAGEGKVGALYILNAEKLDGGSLAGLIKEAREKVSYIAMHSSLDCDLLQYADAVIAATGFAEKEGTFTNYEGRVQKIKAAIKPIGNSLPDLAVLAEILARLDSESAKVENAAAAFALLAKEVEAYAALSFEKLPEEGALISSGLED